MISRVIKVAKNKGKTLKIPYMLTNGIRIDVYKYKIQMRKIIYVESLGEYRGLMRDIDIYDVPEYEREHIINIQNMLRYWDK